MLDEAAPPLHHGRYQLQKVLGAGGMATVYRARDSLLQVDRAIKVLAPHLSKRRSIRERFLLEARSMAKIAAPNVVRVFDFGQDADRVFLVMEVVEGGSLMDRVEQQGPFPPDVAAQLIAGALDGLSAAHEAGYVHRDVKPHNILMTAEGTPKLTDFGIAQAQTDSPNLTRTGTVMGTWAYMAPEQRTDAKRADLRSDLYSMGATLYACVTGADPFDLYVEQVAAELDQRMPLALANVVRRATRYAPDDRFQSAHEMAAALRKVAPQLGSAPPPPVPSAEEPSHTLVPAAGEGFGSETFDPASFDPIDTSADSVPPLFNVHEQPTAPRPAPVLDPPSEEESEVVPIRRRNRWLGPVAGGVLLVAGVLLFVNPDTETATPGSTADAPVPTDERTRVSSADQPPVASPPPAEDVAPEPAPAKSAAAAPPTTTSPKPTASKPPPEPPPPEARRAEAPPPVEPVPEAAPAPAGPPGRVFLNSEPYSIVSIDGTEIGRTPIRGRELPAGVHKVVFRTSDGTQARHSIEVLADQTYRLCWDMKAGEPCK
jgi:serine/threonine protein kinase